MRTYPYSSTHRIEQVDETALRKDLSVAARMTPVSPRPEAIEDPTREPLAYRRVLSPLGIGPRLLDSGPDWVLLEHVKAPELWQCGDLDVWTGVASWLARLHATLTAETKRCQSVPLLTYDSPLFELWRERAMAKGLTTRVADAHQRATERLVSREPSILHGDLYASNLLVDHTRGVKVWPVDWELMGRGPVVLDVAALTAGNWSPDERWQMAESYFAAAHYRGDDSQRWGDLCAARLHLCVQWIGAATDWTSPLVHRHDWLAEADEMAQEV